MSAKKEKKSPKATEKSITDSDSVDFSIEWVAEPILKNVYKYLEWETIQTLSLVCRGWRASITGEVGDEVKYLEKYQAAFPNHEKRVGDLVFPC